MYCVYFVLLGSSDTIVQDRKTENLSNTKSIIQKEEIHVKRTIPQELCPEKEGSLEIDISGNEVYVSVCA